MWILSQISSKCISVQIENSVWKVSSQSLIFTASEVGSSLPEAWQNWQSWQNQPKGGKIWKIHETDQQAKKLIPFIYSWQKFKFKGRKFLR